MKIIELKNISKHFGSDLILDNISFGIFEGDIVGFLGPNGAGKSTTMKILTGLLFPDSGDYLYRKESALSSPGLIKNKIGYLPEVPPIYNYLRVIENLNFFQDIKGVRSGRKKELNRIVDVCGLGEVKNKLAGHLSKGFRQRLGLAIGLLGDPDVLILDEPTVGLDPIQIKETRKLIKHLGKEKTVVLSSHILSEVSEVCNRVIIINKGKILTEELTENLVKKIHVNSYNVETIAEEKDIINELEKIEGVSKVAVVDKKTSGEISLIIESNSDLDLRKDIVNLFSRNNWTLLSLSKTEPTLENIFMDHIKDKEE
ncbi:ATP-binding cassette domain-containing protein [Candidatus Dependentiae bacterium]|nr:ATP-binding cassette domain-containing protein [Candidatus Dependentiae bacterium]